jgi:aspartyl-tRNA(Asn)/glutamyl-tRNA(Gln) amidotransferase subunit A
VAAPDGIFLAQPTAIGEGIRLAVKDLLDIEGVVTTYGSPIFVDHVPNRTAESVRRLDAAGYATVGKTNLHEFAYGITSENPHFGTVPNPIAPGRVAGGSSGGSAAALAAGLADCALGTDSGGSIRIPAACCGVVGFKPTYDVVPTDGCFPLAPSFDTVGPMATTVDRCETMLGVLAPDYAASNVPPELEVACAWIDDADALVAARVRTAAELLHASPIDFPFRTDTYALFMREVADVHRELYADHGDLYGDDVAIKIERCLAVSEPEANAAVHARIEYREAALRALDGFDLLITPTLSHVAPAVGIGDERLRERMIRFTYPFNALGWPALALPCGTAEEGLPASVQLVGRPGADALVLAAGKQLASLI